MVPKMFDDLTKENVAKDIVSKWQMKSVANNIYAFKRPNIRVDVSFGLFASPYVY
jgi:hypothetical protein